MCQRARARVDDDVDDDVEFGTKDPPVMSLI